MRITEDHTDLTYSKISPWHSTSVRALIFCVFCALTGCSALASKLDNVLLDLSGTAQLVSTCLVGWIVYRLTNVALDQLGGAREYGTAEAEIPFPLPIQKLVVNDCRKKTVSARVHGYVRVQHTVKTTHLGGIGFCRWTWSWAKERLSICLGRERLKGRRKLNRG